MQTTTRAHATRADCTAAVDDYMASLVHPQHAVIEALRVLMLGVDPRVQEGIKWNAPSFRTHEYFATCNLRCKTGVGVILHRGAKLRPRPETDLPVADPQAMLRWLGADRASVEFRDLSDLQTRQVAFCELLRAWIEQV